MQVLTTSELQLELSRALRQMHAALEILDEVDVRADIASHLDLAISRLEETLGVGPHAQTSIQTLISQLENELTNASFVDKDHPNPWKVDPM